MTQNLLQDSAKGKNSMFEKGIIVVAITRQGVETALKIKKALDLANLKSTAYAPKKYCQPRVVPNDKSVADFLKTAFSKTGAIVAVMALGITIRALAPLIENKLKDPAVIGVDAAGKFVISLLSGHFGGANELTQIIAKGIDATPVVTTASDSMGKMCVEDIAKILHSNILNPQNLVVVNSAIVNGNEIVIILLAETKFYPVSLSCYEIKRARNIAEAIEIANEFFAAVLVTSENLTIDEFPKPAVVLRARSIVVGLGARKEASKESIIKAVEHALDSIQVPLSFVDRFATVEIKKSSGPMVEAVAEMGAPLEFLSVEALRSVTNDDLSPDSAMVQEKIGVGGVCERAALLVAGKNSRLILKKTKLNGVTVAVAEGE